MKGIILAGGLGTRLAPLTLATNKHLLPVYDRCMIEFPIATLLRAGIDRLMVVTGGPHAGDFLRVLGNGRKLGITHLEYTYQETEGGIADALRLCEDFADSEPVAVVLGDNVTNADLAPAIATYRGGAHLFFKRVADPQRFGVPAFAEDGTLLRIVEKPAVPASDYAVTGLYLYDARVFDIIRTLTPSARKELEITDVNNRYLAWSELTWSELDGYWTDAGTVQSLYYANSLIARERGWISPDPLANLSVTP
jgi:glucose-1-phosphate thymidylyltransferase